VQTKQEGKKTQQQETRLPSKQKLHQEQGNIIPRPTQNQKLWSAIKKQHSSSPNQQKKKEGVLPDTTLTR